MIIPHPVTSLKRGFETYDVGPHGGRLAHICQDRAYRIAKGNPVTASHVSSSVRHRQDDTEKFTDAQKPFASFANANR